jgi:hypothetical protein
VRSSAGSSNSSRSVLVRFVLHIKTLIFVFVLFLARQPPLCHGLLVHDVSISHNDASQSVGLLWKSDQLVAGTST